LLVVYDKSLITAFIFNITGCSKFISTCGRLER